MIMNIEILTDEDFENLWPNSVKHMAESTWSPHVITQDDRGVWMLDHQHCLKAYIKESVQLNPCMVCREDANSLAYIAISGEKVGDIWQTKYFMAGPKEGSSSMAWIYNEIALVSYARHRELADHTGIAGMNMTTSSESSALNAFITLWGAERVGETALGEPMWQTRWADERTDIIPIDLR